MEIKEVKKKFKEDFKKIKDLEDLDKVFRKYLGKKGKISQFFSSLKKMSANEKEKTGKKVNELKEFFGKEIEKEKKKLKTNISSKKGDERIDVTKPGKKTVSGHLHPLTLVSRKIEDIFQNLGFSVVEGPQIENEKYNFDALNIPPDHPARDFWDTLWLKNKGMLLRTHTSPVQVRYMEKNNPPLRIIVPGRIFRYEATDASHEINFYQVEGLMVNKEISVANFRAIIQQFLERFFGKEIKIRMRPSFFPFTEPSFEIDMSCVNCKGKGCSVCSQTGWVEMMGAGMVHPNVFKAAGYNPKNWQGFAFGIGMDRLAMMKYKIDDIRLLYSGDLRFLKQF